MFDLYLACMPSPTSESYGRLAEYVINNNCCILMSQLTERSTLIKWIEVIRDNPTCKCKIFVDSGAFSAWTLNKQIDVDEYISFINDNHEYLSLYASVDNIPGHINNYIPVTHEEIEESAQKTWDNFLYMRHHVKDPDKLIYTFHVGEPYRFLENALNYEDEFGKIKYMAFGGMVGKGDNTIIPFIDKCFNTIKMSSNTNIKVHAFGITKTKILESYPFTSADSTHWCKCAGFGSVYIEGGGTYSFSDTQGSSMETSNPAVVEKIQERLDELNLTENDLINYRSARCLFNVNETFKWSRDYEYRGVNLHKTELW